MSITLADFFPFFEDTEETQLSMDPIFTMRPVPEEDAWEEQEEQPNEQPNKQPAIGTPVGIRVVQSVVRSATQSSLSFFHVAGMGIEVKQGPTISDTMNSKYNRYNTGMTFKVEKSSCVPINKLRKELLGTKFRYFVESVQDGRVTDTSQGVWYTVRGITLDPEDSILRFNISFKRLVEYAFTLEELAQRCFGEQSGVKWVVSPDFMGMIDVHISKRSASAVWISRLETAVCGSNSITAVYFNPLHDAGAPAVDVSTVGSDIALASRSVHVIPGSLRSNNVQDIEENYGVEAAAMALRDIVERDTGGIIADFMARNGMVCSFSKSSVEVKRKGILTSIGYERPREDITRAIMLKDEEQWDIHPSIYSDIMIGTDP